MNKAERLRMVETRMDFLYEELERKGVGRKIAGVHHLFEPLDALLIPGLTHDGKARYFKFAEEYNRLHAEWEQLTGIITN